MNRYFAELIGTFILVFCGTGAIVIDAWSGGTIGHLGVSITFGFVVVAIVYAIGAVSGAHINPAVTVAFALAGRFSFREIPAYVIAQCLGAVLASGMLRLLFPEVITLGETLPAGSLVQSFSMEIILSFFLMFIIINVATGSKEVGIMAGLAIGITVLLEALFAGPVSGASMNPARSLGPALVNLNFQHLWIYFTAPFIGAGISIYAWRAIRSPW